MTRHPRVAVIMGSDSDWSVMQDAAQALAEFDIPTEVRVVSAHRTPAVMFDYARGAADRGLAGIIAGAGGGSGGHGLYRRRPQRRLAGGSHSWIVGPAATEADRRFPGPVGRNCAGQGRVAAGAPGERYLRAARC